MRACTFLTLCLAISLTGRVFAEGTAGKPLAVKPVPVAPRALNDGALTAGRFSGFFFRFSPDEIDCASWDKDAEDWVNDTSIPTRQADPDLQPPEESSFVDVSDQLCAQGASAGPLLLSAFQAGGEDAKDALAALWWGSCTDSTAFNEAYKAFLNSSELYDTSQVLTVAQNYVEAAEELGLAACVTMVVLDSNRDVVDMEQVYTSGGGGEEGADAEEEPLPEGEVAFTVTVGPTAQCQEFDETATSSADRWVNDTSPPWGASGSQEVDQIDLQAFAKDMCAQGSSAGPLLTEAIGAGGQQAQVAVAALLFDSCATDEPRNAAFDAFINAPELEDPATTMDYIRNFVEACDAIGAGCCFSLVVLDKDSNEVLARRKVHTGAGPAPTPAPAPPSPSPPPSNGNVTLEACKAQLQSVSSGCAGSVIAAGSPCCTAVEGIGSACLTLLAADAQSGNDPVVALAVNALFDKCSITVNPAPPTPGGSPIGATCTSAFAAAIGSCNDTSLSPGSACCTGIESLGSSCLREVVASAASNATLSYLITGTLARCQIDLGSPPGPPDSSPPADGDTASLPAGETVTNWGFGLPARCLTWSGSALDFVNMTSPTYWNATGGSLPTDDELSSPTTQLCQGNSSAPAFIAAIQEGGQQAQIWVAAWWLASCQGSYDAANAVVSNIGDLEPNTALRYARNFVEACEALGIGACITVASVDSAGQPLGEVQVHTSVPAAPPVQTRTMRSLHAAVALPKPRR